VKKVFSLFAMLVLLAALTVPTFAWKPFPGFASTTVLAHVPEGAVYIDLLVRKSDLGGDHTDNGVLHGIGPDSEIAAGEWDSYVSFTFHCAYANADIELKGREWDLENSYNSFENYVEGSGGFDDMGKQFRYVRFAYLSEDGTVLGMTNADRTQKGLFILSRTGCLVDGESLKIEFGSGPPYWLIPLFVLGFIIWLVVAIIKNARSKHEHP